MPKGVGNWKTRSKRAAVGKIDSTTTDYKSLLCDNTYVRCQWIWNILPVFQEWKQEEIFSALISDLCFVISVTATVTVMWKGNSYIKCKTIIRYGTVKSFPCLSPRFRKYKIQNSFLSSQIQAELSYKKIMFGRLWWPAFCNLCIYSNYWFS
jgi:hypothetical protein